MAKIKEKIRNLDLFLKEEYFEDVAKRSNYNYFNEKCCSIEQLSVYHHNKDVNFYNFGSNIKCFDTEPVDIVTQDHFYLSSNEVDNNIYQFRNTAFIPQNHDHRNNHDHQSDYDNRTHNHQSITQEDTEELAFSSELHSDENADLIEIHHTTCSIMNRSMYEIDNASISTISDSEFEHDSVHDEICEWQIYSKHCCDVNQYKKLDFKLAQDLAQWAVKKNIKLCALSELLQILRNNYNHQFLPKYAKTLLKTPRNTKPFIKQFKAGGEFWYHGILSGIKTIWSKELESILSDVMEIDVFFDGFSPHNSIRRCLWPIAGCIAGRKEVFIIAIWCGETKNPSDLDAFLEDFINETLKLMNGFSIQNKGYKLKIRNVIADAPARAWLKCVNQHGSKFACERCIIRGEWFGNRMTYPPGKEAPLRTDESLLEQTHKEYHKGVSPLVRLELKLLSQFPLESFHLVYLGIIKRILSMLYCIKASRYKLSNDIILQIDKFCMFLASFFPSNFARRPRRLSDWKYYKGTELRRLLLYDGFLIFKKFPHREIYQNFLLFACAVRILVDPILIKDYATDADKLLRMFVEHSCQIYGLTFVVYNVHHLIHIVADCQLHGSLEEFSAFKFESFLGHLKDLLHAPGRTLSQIVCRVMERALYPSSSVRTELSLEQCHDMGPTLDCQGKQYKKIQTSDKIFRLESGDAYCLTKANEVVKIENIIKCTEKIYLIGRRFREKCDFFSYPFPSSYLNIYIIKTLGVLEKWCFDDIKKKIVLLPLSEKYDKNNDWSTSKSVCLPMPHSETLLL